MKYWENLKSNWGQGKGEKTQLYQRSSDEINTWLLNKDNGSQRQEDYVPNMLKDKLWPT